MLTDKIKSFIKQDSVSKNPEEACGIILNNGIVISCQNISEQPKDSFIINPEQINQYKLDNIYAFYHSHSIGNSFSNGDIFFSEKCKKPYVMYCLESDDFNIYEPKGIELEYINRPFFLGFLDCFSLFQDYYRRELNISFNDTIEHPGRFDYKNWDKPEFFKKHGYVSAIKDYMLSHDFVIAHDIKKHDVIEIKMKNIPFPTHLGLYINNGQILHHLNKYSKIESYSNVYKRLTSNVYRHRSLL